MSVTPAAIQIFVPAANSITCADPPELLAASRPRRRAPRESSPGPAVLCGSLHLARIAQVAVAHLSSPATGSAAPVPHLQRSQRRAVTPPSSCSGPTSRLRERHDATETPDASSRPQPAPPALHSSRALT